MASFGLRSGRVEDNTAEMGITYRTLHDIKARQGCTMGEYGGSPKKADAG